MTDTTEESTGDDLQAEDVTTGELQTEEIAAALDRPWAAFVRATAEHRPALFAFGLQLSGCPFAAEDLVQESLIRAFGSAAVNRREVADLRRYLFRTMSNLWIDERRRAQRIDERITAPEGASSDPDAAELLAAGETVLGGLGPMERTAIVLHESFGFRHREIAAMVATTEQAVRAALSRARRKLREPAPPPGRPVDRQVLDRFIETFRAADIDGLTALLSGDFEASVFPYGADQGIDHAREDGWLRMSITHHHPDYEAGTKLFPTEFQVVELGGTTALVVSRGGEDGMLLEEVWVLETADGVVTRVRDYCFCPEVIRHVADHLGEPYRLLGYSFDERLGRQ